MSRFARAPEIWAQDARGRTLAQVLGPYTVPQLSVLEHRARPLVSLPFTARSRGRAGP